MFGTLVVFLILLGPALLIQAEINRARDRRRRAQGRTPLGTATLADIPAPRPYHYRRGIRPPFGMSWGQTAGLVGGAWAIHEMIEDHHESEAIGANIEHAQIEALGDAQFGSPEYYQAEREHLYWS